jgi:hypothetical protein
MNPRDFAERCLLGVLMTQPARVTPISNWLAPEDLHSPAHSTTRSCHKRAYRQILAAFEHAGAGLRARDLCLHLHQQVQVVGDDDPVHGLDLLPTVLVRDRGE